MLIQIPLDIPDVQIEKLDTSSKKGIVLTLTSTLNNPINLSINMLIYRHVFGVASDASGEALTLLAHT